ncbi:MAG: cysteine synthase A [Fibrobacterota bacterium]
MTIYSDISKTVGRTPLVQINRAVSPQGGRVLAKLEYFNPTSSVKDRIAVNMIDAAEKRGDLKPGGTIVEPTSGNTGLGLSMVAASRGYRIIITMPESMSIERRRLMKQLGAEIVLTDPAKGMNGAIAKAKEIFEETDNAYMPQQFQNTDNPEAHTRFTSEEIWEDTDGKVDAIVAGVGTGGTLTGVSSVLKKRNPDFQAIAVEPKTSAVLSGEGPGKHGIQGIGAGFIPDVLKTDLIDEVITITDEEALEAAREAATKEGILTGISGGANLAAAKKYAERPENKDKTIVTIMCDTGERYLSTKLFEQ